MTTITTFLRSFSLLPLAFILSGCASPTVNLATTEPIKVDINMRLDVYQYGQTGGGPKPAGPTVPPPAANQSPKSRRDNRMADIQQFKNNRLVGEGRDGLIAVRWDETNKQPEEYRAYVRTTVSQENADRLEVMKAMSDAEKISLPDVQAKQAEIWRNRAFKGEWIETQLPDGGTWQWVQKEG